MLGRIVLRISAAVAGLLTLAFAAWCSLLVLLAGAIAAQRPDPSIADGDPCCGHPDTWGEVFAGAGYALVTAALVGLIAAIACGLLVFAARERHARLRRLALVPVATTLTTAVALGVAIASVA